MTHNNALKTQWIKTRSSQIDSIFLCVYSWVCVCVLGFPSPLSLPNLNAHCQIIACSQLLLMDMPWLVAVLVYEILSKLLLFPIVRIEKRAKYSRRRAYNDDADIDYINERNAKFNKKAERFYGKYTAEIKQNLERGTAV